jgi:hypothetical protein
MDKEILNILVNKGIINRDTQLTAMIKGKTFNTGDALFEKDLYYYEGINPNAIKYIEGMLPDRFAKAYNIKIDNKKKKLSV